jgi:DNA-binding Xre family transcriptional regulator
MGNIQIIKSPTGEDMVVMSRADYDLLLLASRDEEDDDIALYDARKAELAGHHDTALPADVSALMLRGYTRLKAIRNWRKLTQSDLARATGIGQGYLSDLETQRRAGAPDTLAALAKALDVPPAWIS